MLLKCNDNLNYIILIIYVAYHQKYLSNKNSVISSMTLIHQNIGKYMQGISNKLQDICLFLENQPVDLLCITEQENLQFTVVL